MSSSLWIEEVCRQAENDEYNDEYKIVLPPNRGQSNRIDEDVEKDGAHRADPGDSQPLGTEAVLPNLARICDQEWCPSEEC